MVQLRLHPRREQQVLLAACASSRPAPAAPAAPAAHLSRRRDRDRPVGFADVAALPDPEWSRSGHNISRYSVAGLVPGGQDALASVPLAEDPRVSPLPIEEQIERAQHVMRSRDVAFEAVMAERGEASAERYAALAAATWMDETIGRLIAEKARLVLDAVTARPDVAGDEAVTARLARLWVLLEQPLPGSYWIENLRAVLPVTGAQLKGSVAL